MFDLESFGQSVKAILIASIPYAKVSEERSSQKHANRNPLHLQQQVESELGKITLKRISPTILYFDLGSERLEKVYPHYHILEDSEVIHKRRKGTKTSKGSQASVSDLGKRNYGRVIYKKKKSGGYTFHEEYRKNIRGKRSALKKETFKVVDDNGVISEYEKVVGTKSNTTYVNEHFHYIEKAYETWGNESLMLEFGLSQARGGNVNEMYQEILDSGNADFYELVFGG